MTEPDYAARGAAHDRERASIASIVRRVGWARLLVFGLLVAGAWGLTRDDGILMMIAGAAALVAFVALVIWHRRLSQREAFSMARATACEVGAARVRRDWDTIPNPKWFDAFAATQQATELHVVGPQSLVRLLPPLTPVAGAPTMWGWLTATEPASLATIVERQAAVRELIPLSDWRERLSVFASRIRGKASSLDGFKRWASDGGAGVALAPWGARLLAIVTVTTIVLAVAGKVPAPVAMFLLALNLGLAYRLKQKLDAVLGEIATADRRIHGLSDLLAEATAPTFSAEGLANLQERMSRGRSASALRSLEKIVSYGDLRYSPMAHAIVQAVVLWDAHILDAAQRWQRAHGPSVTGWLTALGELEAHAALATLGYDNPGWTFPDLSSSDGVIESKDLAHPILPATTRIANDVAFGPVGEVLLVTGPNMAGKSTLLRAIGLNVLLAQTGSSVCASFMRTTRVRLRTSIHAIDALESGVSLFMAELMRVKGIVEDSLKASDAPVLYIVDEMLRGTNSEERHLAVSTVLERLIAAGAIGVVSTHDVELSREPMLAAHLHNVHFGAQFADKDGKPHVSFDYRLNSGPATGRNAMRLLEVMGLGQEKPR